MNARPLVKVALAVVFLICGLHPTYAQGQAIKSVNDKWAIVVGISKFKDSSLDLKYAAKDARDFYNYLITDGHFAPDHVALLLDGEATRQNIISTLGERWLPALAKPQDLVILYFSSHGSPADANIGGVNFLITEDTNKDNVYATGLAMQDLSKLIKDRIPTDKVVLVLDACHSGNIAEESKGIVREANVNADKLAQETGRVVISSSEPSQTSWESKDRPNGVFTHYLIQALKEKGDQTTLSEAFESMKEKVQEEVLRDQGAMQTPVLKGELDPRSIAIAFPPSNPRTVPPDLLPPHPSDQTSGASATAEVAVLPSSIADTQLWHSYLDNGEQARKDGHYVEADKMLAEALKEAEKFGDQDPKLAATLTAVGQLKTCEGKYADAEPLFRKALVICEKVSGPEGAATADTLDGLGKLLVAKGKYTEAEALLKRCLAIREKQFGADSLQVADTLNGLAKVYFEQGKYSQAENTSSRAMEIRQHAGSSDSAEMADSILMSGKLAMVNGRANDAKKLLVRAMEMQERVLNSDHPDLIGSINALAELYTYQGRLAEAEPLLYKSLAISEQSLGVDHPTVADSLDDLALIYELRLKYPQAESSFKRAMDIREKSLGTLHPAIGVSLMNLAWLKYAQEDFPQADSLYRKSQSIMEKSLNQENPKVINTLQYYSYLLNATSRRKQATELAGRIKALKLKQSLENPKAKGNIDANILSRRVSALRMLQSQERKKR